MGVCCQSILCMPASPADQLPPEFRYSAEVIQDNLHHIERRKRSRVDESVYQTDRIQIFCPPVSLPDIPREEHWKWNQTKSRVEVLLPGFELPALLLKLTARKRGHFSLPVPSYKLWLCTIPECESLPEAITVSWCEKGAPRSAVGSETDSPQGSPAVSSTQPSPRIEDYDFLAHLMPESVAKSLWPSSFENNN